VWKSISSFAGGRLTFLEIGRSFSGFQWVRLEFFRKPQVAKYLLSSVTVSLTCTMEFNAMPLCLCVCVYMQKKYIEGVKVEFRAFSKLYKCMIPN